MVLIMERNFFNGMKFEDYPDDTIFVWSEREEDDEWAQEAREQNKK